MHGNYHYTKSTSDFSPLGVLSKEDLDDFKGLLFEFENSFADAMKLAKVLDEVINEIKERLASNDTPLEWLQIHN